MDFDFDKTDRLNKLEQVFHTASGHINDDQTNRNFVKRDFPIEDFALIKNSIRSIGGALTPNEILQEKFVPKYHYPTPFPIGRFTNGYFPAFYTSLEPETSVAEVTYHQSKIVNRDGKRRTFLIIECTFAGDVANLVGQQIAHAELVSQDESGYPFCQKIAETFREFVSGLRSTSARRLDGINVPVFLASAISNLTKSKFIHISFIGGDATVSEVVGI